MKTIKNLSDLLVDDLRTIYEAERMQANTLSSINQNVSSPELRNELRHQQSLKKERFGKLENAFSLLHQKPQKTTNKVVNQIIENGMSRIKNIAENKTADAGVVSTVQNLNHYNIANYGTACAYANATGHQEVAHILHDILKEEKKSDKKLSQISEGKLITHS